MRALQPKPLTRGLSVEAPTDSAAAAEQGRFVERLRNRKTRSLSSGEREEIATIAADKPNIDLEIKFDYNSGDISATSLPPGTREGLSDPNLKGSTFVVAGHTDAVGGESYNQNLSERRADSIKRYLVDKYQDGFSHRRLRQEQAERSERSNGPGQSPRSGRQHGKQTRIKVNSDT